MAKIRAALAKVADALVRDETLLKRARKRHKTFRQRAARDHEAAIKAQKRADHCRAPIYMTIEGQRVQVNYPEPKLAEEWDRKAARCHHRAYKDHLKAQWWLGRIKLLVQRIHKLETRHDKLKARAAAYRKSHGVQIHGNRARGGTQVQREVAVAEEAAARCAGGERPNFYSQDGALDLDHAVTGEPYGHRSDCSSFYTACSKSAGAPDPNGGEYGGTTYTGSLGEHGREVSLAELEKHGTGAILYGPFPYHHVERLTGPGRTIGHGSAPVDPGIPDLFGDGDFHCRIYA